MPEYKLMFMFTLTMFGCAFCAVAWMNPGAVWQWQRLLFDRKYGVWMF